MDDSAIKSRILDAGVGVERALMDERDALAAGDLLRAAECAEWAESWSALAFQMARGL
jgi:hypothetical protein